jgi:hypothetical protein
MPLVSHVVQAISLNLLIGVSPQIRQNRLTVLLLLE